MRNILFICALIASTAISAQTLESKLSSKELKAKQKAELAEFKANQKAQLAAYVLSQKNALSGKKENPFKAPKLVTESDSISYYFGVSQIDGLTNYIVRSLGVDTTKIDAFCQGLNDAINKKDEDETEKAYYAGKKIAADIRRMTKDIQQDVYGQDTTNQIAPSLIASGIIDGFYGTSTKSVNESGMYFNNKVMEKKAIVDAQTKAEGEKFLAENKNKPGVVTLPSGLQYKVIKKGNGKIPTLDDNVRVNYEGSFIDGTVFDSSYKRSESTVFGVKNVIKGWVEALTIMPVGSEWELYIPYQLGYGEGGNSGIPAYSVLKFKIELLNIE